jgi:hypothetical protein
MLRQIDVLALFLWRLQIIGNDVISVIHWFVVAWCGRFLALLALETSMVNHSNVHACMQYQPAAFAVAPSISPPCFALGHTADEARHPLKLSKPAHFQVS